MRDVSCVLLSKSYRKDENGNILRGTNGREISDVTRIEVPIISEENVWKDEFYRANQIRLRPSIRLKLSRNKLLKLKNKLKNILRIKLLKLVDILD